MLGWVILIAAVLFIYVYNGMVIKRKRVEEFLAMYGALGKKRAELVLELLELDVLQDKLTGGEALRQAACQRIDASGWAEKVSCDEALSALWKDFPEQLKAFPELKKVKSNAVLLDELLQLAEKVPSVFKAANRAINSLNQAIDSPLGQALQKLLHLEKYPLLESSSQESADE